MSGWTWFWILWAASFVVAELLALTNRRAGDTFSEHIWTVSEHPTWGKFFLWMVCAFLVWLLVHFATRGRWA